MTKQDILDRIQNVLYQGVDTESQDLDLLRHDLELEILDRIWNVLNQGVDTESGDLDLLRHDLENDVIAKQKFNEECG